MTGPEYVARQMTRLRGMLAEAESNATDREALAFAIDNLRHAEHPMTVGDLRERRYRQRLADTIYNLLGMRDPEEVASWIAGARAELAEHRAAKVRP